LPAPAGPGREPQKRQQAGWAIGTHSFPLPPLPPPAYLRQPVAAQPQPLHGHAQGPRQLFPALVLGVFPVQLVALDLGRVHARVLGQLRKPRPRMVEPPTTSAAAPQQSAR
jgi:hypothetical protein